MQNIIRIELSLGIMFPSVNCYLVPGEQLTLVDCGFSTAENWEIFQKKLAAHGYKIQDIEQVLITHEHQDHIGLLPLIMEHSDAIIRVPKAIKAWFSTPQNRHAAQVAFLQKFYKQVGFPEAIQVQANQLMTQMSVPPAIEDLTRSQFFTEGDSIQMGNAIWQVLNTPGHCPTQHVFLQKDQKQLFSGDMLLPIAPMPIVSENQTEAGKMNHALKDLLASFHRLKAYEVQAVYPGHGPIFRDANTVIEQQLARIEMRKEECLKWHNAGYKTVYEIHQKMYPYHQIPPNFSGIHMIFGYLDLLRTEGAIIGI